MDARKGVLVQSRRHAYIANLLRIPHLLVAVNKMDLVNYSCDAFVTIREAFAEYAARLRFRDVIYIPISALKGDMIVERGDNMPWYDGPALLDLLETIEVNHDINLKDFRFPVQWVCRPQSTKCHDFRGYMGRIESGRVTVGDSITILPSGRASRIKQIVTYDGVLSRAFAPQSVTLLLEDDLDVSRGDMVVKSRDDTQVASEFNADICWLSEQPLDTRRKYLIKHTTKIVKAWLTRIEHQIDINDSQLVGGIKRLQMNDIARVGIKSQQSLVIDSYARNRATGSFILIDEATNNTVGARMIA
jgi:sulfate adenylyltransferase subunit 1